MYPTDIKKLRHAVAEERKCQSKVSKFLSHTLYVKTL